MHTKMRMIAAMLLAAALAATGCHDKVPESELDRFVKGFEGLSAAATIDTLRQLAAGPEPESVYANYHLGNVFYAAAVDTANARGWNYPVTGANLDSAEVYFSRAVAADSLLIEGFVNLGAVWDDRSEMVTGRAEREQRMDEAERLYRHALRIDPDNEKARCNLGALYLRQNNGTAAKEEFQQVLAHNPRSALAHYNLAIMFAEAKIYQEAIREWELAAKYDADGDIGQRSRENIEIIQELQQTELPTDEVHP